VIEVGAVVLPTGVVQKGEKVNNGQVGAAAFSDIQAKSINPLPVVWPVDGMRSALENGHHVFTNSSKPSLWRAFHIRKSSDSLFHRALLVRGACKSYRRGPALSKLIFLARTVSPSHLLLSQFLDKAHHTIFASRFPSV
jgi:hypothetical protein